MPEISILTATFQNAQYIEEAIRSILSQTFHNWELIIVDDGSIDDTEERVRPYLDDHRIKYICQANCGQAAARNKAYQLSKGEYIAILDSDDFWHETKLQKEVNLLKRCPELGLVYTGVIEVDADGKNIKKRYIVENIGDDPLTTLLLGKNPIVFSSVLLNRRFLNPFELQETSIKCSDEWITLLRVALRARRFAFIDETLTFYRVHNASRTFVEGVRNNRAGRMQTIELFFQEEDLPQFALGLKKKAIAAVYFSAAHRYNDLRIAPLAAMWNVLLSLRYDPFSLRKALRQIIRTVYLHSVFLLTKKGS